MFPDEDGFGFEEVSIGGNDHRDDRSETIIIAQKGRSNINRHTYVRPADESSNGGSQGNYRAGLISGDLESNNDNQSVYRYLDDQSDTTSNDGRFVSGAFNKNDHRVSYYVNNDALRNYNGDEDDDDDNDSVLNGLGGGRIANNRRRDSKDDY